VPERAQKQPQPQRRAEEPAPAEAPKGQGRPDAKRLRDRIDAVIEEIDKVVEENQGLAESFVQQGGE